MLVRPQLPALDLSLDSGGRGIGVFGRFFFFFRVKIQLRKINKVNSGVPVGRFQAHFLFADFARDERVVKRALARCRVISKRLVEAEPGVHTVGVEARSQNAAMKTAANRRPDVQTTSRG